MFTFQFSQTAWLGMCLDFRLLWGKGQTDGCLQVVDKDGQSLVLTHAGSTGLLYESPDFIRSLDPDVVICCFPRQAKRLYPDLPILGNWPAKTYAHGCGVDHVLCIEEDKR